MTLALAFTLDDIQFIKKSIKIHRTMKKLEVNRYNFPKNEFISLSFESLVQLFLEFVKNNADKFDNKNSGSDTGTNFSFSKTHSDFQPEISGFGSEGKGEKLSAYKRGKADSQHNKAYSMMQQDIILEEVNQESKKETPQAARKKGRNCRLTNPKSQNQNFLSLENNEKQKSEGTVRFSFPDEEPSNPLLFQNSNKRMPKE